MRNGVRRTHGGVRRPPLKQVESGVRFKGCIPSRRESDIGNERLDLILHRMDLMRGAVDETCTRIKAVEDGLASVRTHMDKMAATGIDAGTRPYTLGSNLLT